MKRIFATLGVVVAALVVLILANGAVNAQSGNMWNLFYFNTQIGRAVRSLPRPRRFSILIGTARRPRRVYPARIGQ